jgi:hypothetical protein
VQPLDRAVEDVGDGGQEVEIAVAERPAGERMRAEQAGRRLAAAEQHRRARDDAVGAQRLRAPGRVVRQVVDDHRAAGVKLAPGLVGERADLELRADEPVGEAARGADPHHARLAGALEQVRGVDAEPVADRRARRVHQHVEARPLEGQLAQPRDRRLLRQPQRELRARGPLGAQLGALVPGQGEHARDLAVVGEDRDHRRPVVLVVGDHEAPRLAVQHRLVVGQRLGVQLGRDEVGDVHPRHRRGVEPAGGPARPGGHTDAEVAVHEHHRADGDVRRQRAAEVRDAGERGVQRRGGRRRRRRHIRGIGLGRAFLKSRHDYD